MPENVLYVRHVRSAASVARMYAVDALIVIATIGSALEVALRGGAVTEPGTTPWLAAAGVGLVILPLLARRRFPFGAPISVWLIAALISFLDGRMIPLLGGPLAAGLAAAFLLGNLRDSVQRRLGLAVVLVGVVVIVANKPGPTPRDFIVVPVLLVISWAAGFALQERSEEAEAAEARATHAEHEQEAAARVAVAEERARIARELHDIVAHAVSTIVLQVGAVRHTLPQNLEQQRDALMGVERAGRTALSEMRHLLGAMRDDREDLALAPQPGLGSLGSLLEQVDRAGLPVELEINGEAFPIPPAIDRSAYRIIQEGLTNALKHARASRAEVTVRYSPHQLHIQVHDNGHGELAGRHLGHGLHGIRERVAIHGGEMNAGTANGGGYTLTARLPIQRHTP